MRCDLCSGLWVGRPVSLSWWVEFPGAVCKLVEDLFRQVPVLVVMCVFFMYVCVFTLVSAFL